MSEMSSSATARALAVEAQIEVDTEILDSGLNGHEEIIANPLREGMFHAVTATPCAMIIFGVSGGHIGWARLYLEDVETESGDIEDTVRHMAGR